MLTIEKIKTYALPLNASRKNNLNEFLGGVAVYNDSINLYDAIVTVMQSSGGGGITNLSYTVAASNGTVVSDTGTDAVIPEATTQYAGLLLPADKSKLNNLTITQPVNLDTLELQVENLFTLAGVVTNHLGSFTGTLIPDNQSIKSALQYLETAIQSTGGNSENGIVGTGTASDKFRLGGNLNTNTVISGSFTNYLALADASLISLEADNNVSGNARSLLSLTTSTSSGALLRSEINGSGNQYAEVRLDPDDTLTYLQRATSDLKAGLFIPNNQTAELTSTDTISTKKFKVNQNGHFLEGIKSGSTSKTLFIDDTTGEVYKGTVGTGTSTLFRYSAGSDCIVTATAEGITFTKSAGVGTFNIPTGVTLISARINGVMEDLAVGNHFTISIPTSFIDDFPTVTKINRGNGSAPTTSIAYNYDIDNSPLIQVIESTTSSTKVRVINLNAFTHWALKVNF
jgi:hypothetical protein